MNLEIAVRSDVDMLLQIERETFDKYSFPLSRRNFLYHIDKKHIIITKVDNVIVGYLLFFTYRKSWRIYSIAITKAYRNHKLGTALVNHLIETAKDSVSAIHLEVKTTNTQAIRFYNTLEFKPCKVLKNYYPDADGIKMILKL